jgi:Tol biopolymer transport system component
MSYGGISTTPRTWQCIVDHYYNDNGNTSGAESLKRTSFINGPGGDGPVALTIWGNSSSDIYTMGIDGSNLARLTSDRTDRMPSWSPGGHQIVFSSSRGSNISTINSNGTNEIQIEQGGWVPAWSPLGGKISFLTTASACNNNDCLSVMNSDGSGQMSLGLPAWSPPEAGSLAWSPDGTKIAYVYNGAVYVTGADGTGNTLIYNDPSIGYAWDPSWSPDGTKISLGINSTINAVCGIYIMKSDGTGLSRITNPANCLTMCERHPSWSSDGQTLAFQSNRNNPGNCTNFQVFTVTVAYPNIVTLINSSVSNEPTPDCRHCGRFDNL